MYQEKMRYLRLVRLLLFDVFDGFALFFSIVPKEAQLLRVYCYMWDIVFLCCGLAGERVWIPWEIMSHGSGIHFGFLYLGTDRKWLQTPYILCFTGPATNKKYTLAQTIKNSNKEKIAKWQKRYRIQILPSVFFLKILAPNFLVDAKSNIWL